MAQSFDQRKAPRGGAPPLPQHLTAVLTALYLTDSEAPSATYRVPVAYPADMGLLAWVWLLGPFNHNVATIGPPRHATAAVSPPLTYEAEIEGTIPDVESEFLRNVVNTLSTSPYSRVVEKINALRRNRKTRRKLLRLQGAMMQSPAEPPSPDDFSESASEQPSRRITIPRLRREDVWGGLLLLMLVFAWLRLEAIQQRAKGIQGNLETLRTEVRQSTALRGIAGSQTATSSGAVPDIPAQSATAHIAVVNWARENVSRKKGGLRYTDEVVNFAKKANAQSPADADRLYVAALQMHFTRQGWYNAAVDGQLGRTISRAAHVSRASADFVRAISDDDYLLAQLQAQVR